MKISKQQLIDMRACKSGLERIVEQTNNTDEPVEIASLINGKNNYYDLLWLASKLLPKERIFRFACDVTLINIELIKPYTDQYDLIVDFLKSPTTETAADANDAVNDAADAAADAAAADAADAVADAVYAAFYAAAANAAADAVADAVYAAFYADAANAADVYVYVAADADVANAAADAANAVAANAAADAVYAAFYAAAAAGAVGNKTKIDQLLVELFNEVE